MFQAVRTTRSHLLQSISSQFGQRCFAGGTPKGKAKIKEGGPKKRSKITNKKKPADAGDPSLRPASHAENEKYKLYEACINAPTPVRFLKPKERAREAEREKLGLESKERKREKENLKKGGKGEFDSPFIMGTPGLDLISLGMVDVEKIPKYELTAEDGKRLAKEYSRVLMRKHRARQAALSSMLRCKKEAIEALPEDLKKEALVNDYTPFPPERGYAMLTPPIEGYMEKVMEAANRSSGSEKIR